MDIKDDDALALQADFVSSFSNFGSVDFFQSLFNSFPNATAILNSSRQIIFANTLLVQKYGYGSLEEILGHRPGEILNCFHTSNGAQCGTSESCKVCGAFRSINESLLSRHIVTNEFRITRKVGGKLKSAEFNITVSPIIVNNKPYLILYILDITDEKRRGMLERIFFHDVLNKAGSLGGFFQLMKKEKSIDRVHQLLDVSSGILHDMTDEVQSQRQLLAAERGELYVKKDIIVLTELINKLREQFKNFRPQEDININFSDTLKPNLSIVSDEVLLNRVVSNVIKNAVEASVKGDNVSIFTSMVNDMITIAVHNAAFIPRESQLQIFQRSFSTKGEGRGLGTYSIRLLTEQYLNGTVRFISSPQEGTTFYIELPQTLK